MKIKMMYPKNPRGQQYQNRQQIRSLTHKSKDLFSFFNIFELEMSRFSTLDNFKKLLSELREFNRELERWKLHDHIIANITMTYSLYENLFSRLRYIMNFSRSSDKAMTAIADTKTWFFTEKPKVRCEKKQVKSSMKQPFIDKQQTLRTEDLMQSYEKKREMQPFQTMSRTAYNELLPPKQQLKSYKRKQIFSEGEKRSSSLSDLNKVKLNKYRESMMTTMRTTQSTFRSTSKDNFLKTQTKTEQTQEKQAKALIIEENNQFDDKIETINLKTQEQEKKDINQELQIIDREKKAQNEQIMQQMVIPNPEDAIIDEEDYLQVVEQEDRKTKKKVYIMDHTEQEFQIMEQLSKEPQQSSLRRMLKINEEKIRSKMQDLNIKQNIMNWGKLKSDSYKQSVKVSESLKHLNQYKQMGYRPKTNDQLLRYPEIVDLGTTERAKSSNLFSQTDVSQFKVKQTVAKYGRYISSHINSEKGERDIQTAREPIKSLTSINFALKQQRKAKMASTGHYTAKYNRNIDDDINRIKTVLSGKAIPIEGKAMQKGLGIATFETEEKEDKMHYKTGRTLLSNPFFPKTSKKKKKK